jgi:mRNA-degrading endonuclease RelE of RelBE toxin-antitoxin system
VTPDPLDLTRPESSDGGPWALIAYNKRVLKGWNGLCQNTPEQAARCYDWLSRDAMMPIPGRCYAMKGKVNAGCWCYEIGAGNRVYYKPDKTTRTVTVYYAGEHPTAVPPPPSDI